MQPWQSNLMYGRGGWGCRGVSTAKLGMLYLRNKQEMAAVVLRKNNGMLYKYNKKGTPEPFSASEGRRRANRQFSTPTSLLFLRHK